MAQLLSDQNLSFSEGAALTRILKSDNPWVRRGLLFLKTVGLEQPGTIAESFIRMLRTG